MFKRIHIENLGAHVDTTLALSPMGATHISGPSRAGKSLIVDAALFAALGLDRKGNKLPASRVRTGEPKATATLTTARGSTIFRSMTRKRTTRRKFNGDACNTEEVFGKAHGLSRKVAGVYAVQLIMAPMSWCPLAAGAGGGQPLLDVLATFADGTDRDEVARLMEEAGHALRPGEVVGSKFVATARANANRARTKAAGKLEGAEAVEVIVPEAPDAGAVESARALLDLSTRWGTYEGDVERYDRDEARRLEVAERVASWDSDLADLGDKPASDPSGVDKARKASDDAERMARTARESVRVATSKLAALQSAPPWVDEVLQAASTAATVANRDLMQAVADGDSCPKCERPEWPKAAARLEHLRGLKAAADKALTAAKRGAKTRAKDAEAVRAHALAEAEAALQRLTETSEAAERRKGAKSEALIAAYAPNAEAAAWGVKRKALGDRPADPSAKAEAPEPPTGTKPEAKAVADAEALLKAATRAAGAIEQAARQQAEATKALAEATAALASASLEATRAEALVVAVRAAPGARLARCLGVLGDIGPVSLRIPEADEDGGKIDALEVLIDGLPWDAASEGELIHADACFRAGLRRALGMPYVPVAVDAIQNWSGELPEIAGPVWYLRTVAGGELRSDDKKLKTQPRNMLRARAISNGARAYCPDLLTGVYHTGELDDPAPARAPMQDVTLPEPEPLHRWTPEEQRRFFALLKDFNGAQSKKGRGEVTYEDLKAWLESAKRPKPSAMLTDAKRGQVLDYLNTDAGQAKYWAWIDDREEAKDIEAREPEPAEDAEFEEVKAPAAEGGSA